MSGTDEDCSLDMSSYPDYFAHGYDNTFGGWLTNYILTACIVGYAAFFTLARRAPFLLEHTRMFLIGKYVSLGISVFVAGLVHHGALDRAGDITAGANAALWATTEATLVIAGGFTASASWSLLTLQDNSLRSGLAYLVAFGGGSVLAIWVVFTPETDLVSGVMGELVPNIVLMIALIVGCKVCECGKDLKPESQAVYNKFAGISVSGILVIFLGAFIQVFYGPVCGIPCPVDCPFPAPKINHDVIFHVIQAIGMGMLAVGMNGVCGTLEMGVLAESGKPAETGVLLEMGRRDGRARRVRER